MQEVVRLRRNLKTAEGVREVAWSVLRPQPGVFPEGRVQFAYCHTPDLTWPPGAGPPANQAEALSDTLVCVADRREAAARFGGFAGRMPRHRDAISIVPLDRGRLVFTEPDEAAKILPGARLPAVPFMAGQAVRSADIATTHAALSARGVTPAFADRELVLYRSGGCARRYLLFHAAALRDPWAALAARRM